MTAIMLAVRRAGLHNGYVRALAGPHFISHPALQTRHYASLNPIDWFRSALIPRQRKSRTPEEIEQAKRKAEAKGTGSLLETGQAESKQSKKISELGDSNELRGTKLVGPPGPPKTYKKWADHHKYSTANFKISPRKLNVIGRQVAGQPIDMAIVQMQFSEKRASKRIMSMLAIAKRHAERKGLNAAKMIVSEAWVSKGARYHKRANPQGRGRTGIKHHPEARMHVILKEGKTREELLKEMRERRLRRIVSSGIVRENVPVRSAYQRWAW